MFRLFHSRNYFWCIQSLMSEQLNDIIVCVSIALPFKVDHSLQGGEEFVGL